MRIDSAFVMMVEREKMNILFPNVLAAYNDGAALENAVFPRRMYLCDVWCRSKTGEHARRVSRDNYSCILARFKLLAGERAQMSLVVSLKCARDMRPRRT